MKNFHMFRKWAYKYLGWLFLVISLLLLWLSEADFFIPKANELMQKFAFGIFSSGVFAVVLKSIQFSGLFKEEIEKVILGTEFIKNRNDLPQLWKAISQTIYKSKFPAISDILEDRILNTYFPTQKDFYYEDYIVTINIESLTEDLIITYTQTCKYNVILDKDLHDTKLTLKTSVNQMESAPDPLDEIEFFKIDGEDFTPKEDDSTLEDDAAKKYTIPLRGSGPFKIHSKVKRRYSLTGENYKLFRMTTFTKNMDVTISYPDNVCVSFFGIGNVNHWEKQHVEVKNQISRTQKDVILPYQGFGMSFENMTVKK